MASLRHLNVFISERLTAAAVEIFGAVEKTLIEYQGEISRSKQEINHLRTLLLWPEVRLHRSAVHQLSPQCCEEASPECCLEEEWAPRLSPDHPSTLHVKEEIDQGADRQEPSCRQQSGTNMSPQFVKGDGHEESHSHLSRILTAEKTADIKAEPDSDEFATSLSTREAEIPCGINPESSGLQRETRTDQLEITHHERNGPDEQQYTEPDWSLCQDHEDPDPPRIKVEKFTASSCQEETDQNHKLRESVSERRVYDYPYSSSPRHNQTFYTAEERRRDAEAEGFQLYGLSRGSQPFFSINQSEYGMHKEDVVNAEWIKALTSAETRSKKRPNLYGAERDGVRVEEDLSDLSRERRHTCPICGKRFKESSHLKDHVRIHTGEKPYRCKECGVNFRQSGALTLHMRIHTGERPYQCTDCGRRFNRKGDMETHRVTHTGERPHLCMVCGKSFKRKSNLNTHLKIHTS